MVVVVDLTQSGGKGKKSKGKKQLPSQIADQNEVLTTTQTTSSSNASQSMTPKRSRSEAPEGNSISNVLYEVHKKLSNRGRKLSPAKMQAKQ